MSRQAVEQALGKLVLDCERRAAFFHAPALAVRHATRHTGMIYDFVLLNAIRDLPRVRAALRQASNAIREALKL